MVTCSQCEKDCENNLLSSTFSSRRKKSMLLDKNTKYQSVCYVRFI